jgi:scavenger receptor class B, member 1
VFSFREALEHENVTFNLNGTLSYIPRRFPIMTDKLVLDTSLGRGLEDRLVVPNIPLLVICSSDMHNIFETIKHVCLTWFILQAVASKLSDESFFIQLGFSTLVNYVDSQPFDHVSVKEYLWGYEDPIVRLANFAHSSVVTFPQLGLLDRVSFYSYLYDSQKKHLSYKIPNFLNWFYCGV